MEQMAGLIVALIVLAIIVLVLWIFLPFAVFGAKPLLRQQIELLQAQNHLLRELAQLAREKKP